MVGYSVGSGFYESDDGGERGLGKVRREVDC